MPEAYWNLAAGRLPTATTSSGLPGLLVPIPTRSDDAFVYQDALVPVISSVISFVCPARISVRFCRCSQSGPRPVWSLVQARVFPEFLCSLSEAFLNGPRQFLLALQLHVRVVVCHIDAAVSGDMARLDCASPLCLPKTPPGPKIGRSMPHIS